MSRSSPRFQLSSAGAGDKGGVSRTHGQHRAHTPPCLELPCLPLRKRQQLREFLPAGLRLRAAGSRRGRSRSPRAVGLRGQRALLPGIPANPIQRKAPSLWRAGNPKEPDKEGRPPAPQHTLGSAFLSPPGWLRGLPGAGSALAGTGAGESLPSPPVGAPAPICLRLGGGGSPLPRLLLGAPSAALMREVSFPLRGSH